MRAAPHNNRRDNLVAVGVTVVLHLLLVVLLCAVTLAGNNDEEYFAHEPNMESEEHFIEFEPIEALTIGGTPHAPIVDPVVTPQLAPGTSQPSAPARVEQPAPDRPQETFTPDVRFHAAAATQEPGDGGMSATSVVQSSQLSQSSQSVNINGLDGFTLDSFTRPHAAGSGVIAVKVVVDADGNVIKAHYHATKSYGSVSEDSRARQQCVDKANNSRFKVSRSLPADYTATGYILYTF